MSADVPQPQPLFGPAADGAVHVARLLADARAHFAARNQRKTIDALHQAQQVATQHQLHAEATQLRRALAILANGGRPKLLGHGALKPRSK